VSQGPRRRERGGGRRREPLAHRGDKCAVRHRKTVRAEQFVGAEADEGRVVLVDTLKSDSIRGGADRPGDRLAPGEMLRVEHARPVDRADHLGGASAKNDEPHRLERIEDFGRRGDPAATERVSDGRREVGAEGRDP
jgi:hypothetical protein